MFLSFELLSKTLVKGQMSDVVLFFTTNAKEVSIWSIEATLASVAGNIL